MQLARQSISDKTVLAKMEAVITGEVQGNIDDASLGATNCNPAHSEFLLHLAPVAEMPLVCVECAASQFARTHVWTRGKDIFYV